MSKWILNPYYGDMSVVVLGSSVSAIIKSFKRHWEDELDAPEDYDKKHIKAINKFFEQNFTTPEEIDKFYSKNFDEDYHMERSN